MSTQGTGVHVLKRCTSACDRKELGPLITIDSDCANIIMPMVMFDIDVYIALRELHPPDMYIKGPLPNKLWLSIIKLSFRRRRN